MAKKIPKGAAAPSIPKTEADDIVGPAIPDVVPPPAPVKPDLSDPWYRPAKQFIRREQWNARILHLLNKLPAPDEQSEVTIRYVGLPGQHHFDVLSMQKICITKRIRLEYLGFRSEPGLHPDVTYLDQLAALSNTKVHTPNSIVVPDRVEHICKPNTLANSTFKERGPFDVINLDVCGGLLHGNSPPLLAAVKFVLSNQTPRQLPWLLFITTIAKPEQIAKTVIEHFFATIDNNCTRHNSFKSGLSGIAAKLGLKLDETLKNPGGLSQLMFLKFFTLALGKWILSNLVHNSPRSLITMRTSYWFRNTGHNDPEMLSLVYLVTPKIVGGPDPTKITTVPLTATVDQEYEECASKLIKPSIEEMADLDEVWNEIDAKKEILVAECEGLLKLIGVDDDGVAEWRAKHGLT